MISREEFVPLPSNSIIFRNEGREVMRITNNAVIVPEDITPNEAAEALMQIVGEWVDNMVRTAVLTEREACLNCYSPDDSAADWADKIRARGDE